MKGVLLLACAVLPAAQAFFSAALAADAGRGKQLYESRCVGCHSIDENRVGPAHRGVFGRKAG
ncbi:MAG TPA: c-type cytochrome, partial [Burkholderiales bacterium]|nr:c-type cytochrome [Burkholderiales bacterium]